MPSGRQVPAGPEKNSPYWKIQEDRYNKLEPVIPRTINRKYRYDNVFQQMRENIVVSTSTIVPPVQLITESAVFPE